MVGQSGLIVGNRSEPGEYEVTEIVFKAKAGISDNETVHFYLADGDETETDHYIWFDVTGAGADPGGGGTPHKVDIQTDTSEADVADAVHTVVNAVGGITTVDGGSGLLTLTNDYKGNVTEATQGAHTCCTSITITTAGEDFDVAYIDTSSTDNRIHCPYCDGIWFQVKDSYMMDDGDLPAAMDGYNLDGTVGNIIFLCHCGKEFGKPKTDWAEMLGSN